MTFEVSKNLKLALYGDGLIVFDPNSGQTHNLDTNSIDIIQYIQNSVKPSTAKIIEHITVDCSKDEKTLLSQYIQDIIENLVQLKIIKVVECN